MPTHARSFSNDRATLQPLEPRKSRRSGHWEQHQPSDQDAEETRDDAAPSQHLLKGMHQRSSSGSGSSSRVIPFDGNNPHFRDISARDAESQRPLTPVIEEKPSPVRGAGAGVTWMSLPRKDQLLILFIGRMVDFLQIASMQAYVFFQLKSFDESLTDAQISQQAGLLQGCFTGAQVLTAILWGKAADAGWCGRKWVLVIGLGGTALSCLGYGFATTFFWAAFWRAFGGIINGTVGIM